MAFDRSLQYDMIEADDDNAIECARCRKQARDTIDGKVRLLCLLGTVAVVRCGACAGCRSG